MGVPEPIHALTGHCSVIHENTLYAYSPAGFQSLELTEGAQWTEEPMDISLTGARCVKAVPGGDSDAAMLYIVGGSVNETVVSWNYPGLMHYSFAEKKWDWVRPESWVTQNRKNHGAAYLDDLKALLVFSGAQSDGVVPSSETFLISTLPPFNISTAPANDIPPSVKPMLMDWDGKSAVMVGGGAQNQGVFLFNNPTTGWQNLGVTLTEPITNQDAVQCTIVSGDDGSRVLEKFDMSVSPNKVTRVALLSQGGTVAPPGTSVGDKIKRVTVEDWAAYNGTLAPTATRTSYSIAQGENGKAVISGGSDQDPLCIFDQSANAWVNATELFDGQQVVIQSTPSATASSKALSSSATITTTSALAASSSAAAVAPSTTTPVNNKTRMLTVLGATLGAIFGIAALMILLLFCLKYRKAKNKKAQQTAYVEKDRLSFADRGAEFMSEAGGSIGHKFVEMNGSQSSLAIVSGQAGNNHKRGLGPLGSDASTAGLVQKKSPLAYTDPVEMSKLDMKPEPANPDQMVRQNSARQPNVGRSRSSGWSRYFANNEATNLAAMPSQRSTFASERTSTGSQSMYNDTRMYSQPSQTVPPLHIPKFDGQRLSRVVTGSPTLGNSKENLPHQPMQAELGRADSNGSSRSGVSGHDHYYERAPVESWTPMSENKYERPASSNYTNSVVVENTRDNASSYYPDGTSSFYPKSNNSSFYPGQPPPLGLPEGRESTVTMFPRGVPDSSGPSNRQITGQPATEFRVPDMPPRLGQPEGRESTVTMFPRVLRLSRT
ncbi:hypothetical protein P154DRAFT_552915 [Amniculicola lignicola CBS 123094]|uniref:Galactose oxidase n=1 Tax=Amniculicola lignicola CBS 123094 TaxID=1392246 RepID=A0A6A5WRX3_9PLEO|nr:hypothetical protein P154DRAFT_552915 [Amniculicola lignicola CBS 123094]